jgi:hypothetical protein
MMVTMAPWALRVDQDVSVVAGGAASWAAIERRLRPSFERAEPRQRAMAYGRGLLSPAERKHSWQLAEVSGAPRRKVFSTCCAGRCGIPRPCARHCAALSSRIGVTRRPRW